MINESNCEGLTPLHIASQEGNEKIVQQLLNKGALIHRDDMGRSPLHLSAINGHVVTTNMLLSVHSHLLDHTDKDGVSILFTDIWQKNVKKYLVINRLFIEYGIAFSCNL